jgi:hypothetical protein
MVGRRPGQPTAASVRAHSGEPRMRGDSVMIARRIDNRYFVGFVAADTAHNPLRIELRNHHNASLKIESAPAGVTS